jgi:hypothetical protein
VFFASQQGRTALLSSSFNWCRMSKEVSSNATSSIHIFGHLVYYSAGSCTKDKALDGVDREGSGEDFK